MSIKTTLTEKSIVVAALFIFIINIIPSIALAINITYNLSEEQKEALKVYIDYGRSNNTEKYMITEITFVDHVRDPYVAQVHVLITDTRTASGGRRYNISIIGLERFSGQDLDLIHNSPQSDTENQRREGLAQIIRMGLMPYVSQTSLANQVKIKYDNSKPQINEIRTKDAWDHWIFNFDIGGGGRQEEGRDAFNIYSNLRANRVTEEWRTQNSFSYRYDEENFRDGKNLLKSTLQNWDFYSTIVKSLSDHWSTGLSGRVFSTTYRNIRLGGELAPAIEYNYFPWREAQREHLTFAYKMGVTRAHYYEETLYDKWKETLLFHAMDIKLEMTQPWGKIYFNFAAQQYPTLINSYSLKLYTDISVRLSSSFSIFFNTRIQKIHDQTYLPKGDASIDDILLRRKQLATTYYISYRLGLRFTFGSIYNNIVNLRL
jgi:hypothetical protein